MMLEQFGTREAANRGVRMPLRLPDGSATEYWLLVLGRDSDTFRRSEFDMARRLRALGEQAGDYEAIESAKLDMLCGLIAGWNLEDEFTPDNVRSLLVSAPQIAEAVDALAGDRTLFFSLASADLRNTQNGHSGSKSGQKAATKVSEKA